MTRFSDWMITENLQVFWAAMQLREFITDAAEAAGTCRKKGARLLVASGGVRPRRGRDLKGRCLSFLEREENRAGSRNRRVVAVDRCSPWAQSLDDLQGACPQSGSESGLPGDDGARVGL